MESKKSNVEEIGDSEDEVVVSEKIYLKKKEEKWRVKNEMHEWERETKHSFRVWGPWNKVLREVMSFRRRLTYRNETRDSILNRQFLSKNMQYTEIQSRLMMPRTDNEDPETPEDVERFKKPGMIGKIWNGLGR